MLLVCSQFFSEQIRFPCLLSIVCWHVRKIVIKCLFFNIKMKKKSYLFANSRQFSIWMQLIDMAWFVWWSHIINHIAFMLPNAVGAAIKLTECCISIEKWFIRFYSCCSRGLANMCVLTFDWTHVNYQLSVCVCQTIVFLCLNFHRLEKIKTKIRPLQK